MRFWFFVVAMAFGCRQLPAGALSADEVMRRAMERAAQRSAPAGQGACMYTKVSVTEDLDSAGKVKSREEKVYEVTFRAGLTAEKLRTLNGRPLDDAQIKKQAETEAKLYKSLGPSKSGKGDRREALLTPELVGRYDFSLVGTAPLDGRNAFQLAFAPKSNTPSSRQFMERLLGRVAGTIWIDAEDFEIARADIRLNSSVELLGGVLGSLKKMAVTLNRSKLADGQWFTVSSSGDFQGRKLFDSISMHTSSLSTNFRTVRLP